MKLDRIKTAEAEARRFLERVAPARRVLTVPAGLVAPYSSAEVAALRRASLDLTRALAALRRRA